MKRWVCSLALILATMAAYAQWSNPGDDVPAYHAESPAKTNQLPPILAGTQLTGSHFEFEWQVAIYKEAAKIPGVLFQLPCYCRCDRAMGHQSLRSCFEGLHGAECSTCLKEAHFAYLMTAKGKTVQQIREGINHREYESIDYTQVKM
jgi:hypothetical protein